MFDEIVRRTSSVLRTTKSKDILRAIEKAIGKAELMAAHEGETLAIYRVLREALPPYADLGPYRRVRQVHAIRRFAVDPAERPAFVEACARLGSGQARMYVQSRGIERGTEGEADLTVTTGSETLVPAGKPLDVSTTSPMCSLEINAKSPGYLDKAYRRDLFARALEAMGCPDALKLELIDGTLTVAAADGWSVKVNRADLADRDPCGITLYGFGDVRAAMDAGERVAGRLFRRLDQNRLVSITSEEEVYESLRCPLNELADSWEVTVVGNLTAAAATVLAGRVLQGEVAPARLPAIHWVREGTRWDSLTGELVAVDGGYALELACQTLPAELLDACIRAVEASPARKR